MTQADVEVFIANPNRPFPDISHDGEPFWQGLREGELRIQQCDSCGQYRHPPRMACPSCAHIGATWRTVELTGSVYTYTVVHRPPDDGFRPFVPYVIAVVDLVPGGIRLIGNILGSAADEVGIGAPVNIVIDKVNDETSLYHFELANQ